MFLSFLGVQIVCCYLWSTVGSRLEYPTRSTTRDQQLQKNILVSCVPFYSLIYSVDTLVHRLISSRWLEVALNENDHMWLCAYIIRSIYKFLLMRAFKAPISPAFALATIILGTCISYSQASA